MPKTSSHEDDIASLDTFDRTWADTYALVDQRLHLKPDLLELQEHYEKVVVALGDLIINSTYMDVIPIDEAALMNLCYLRDELEKKAQRLYRSVLIRPEITVDHVEITPIQIIVDTHWDVCAQILFITRDGLQTGEDDLETLLRKKLALEARALELSHKLIYPFGNFELLLISLNTEN